MNRSFPEHIFDAIGDIQRSIRSRHHQLSREHSDGIAGMEFKALRFIAADLYLPAIPVILVVAATVAMIPRNRLVQIQILLPAALGVAAVEVLLVNGIPLAPALALALAVASLGTGVWLSGLRPRAAH